MKKLLQTILGNISSKKEWLKWSTTISAWLYDTMTILPESVRYAMQYKHANLWKEEINSLLHPSFWITWLYILAKYYADNSSAIENILTTFVKYHKDYSILYAKLRDFHMEQWEKDTIDGNKVAILGRYWFKALDQKFDDIVSKANESWVTPICLLYSGLLWLPSLINHFSWSDFFLFDLKQPSNSYVCKKDWWEWYIQKTIISHEEWKNYVLIDDVLHTWKSYQKAVNVLSEYGFDKDLEILVPVKVDSI